MFLHSLCSKLLLTLLIAEPWAGLNRGFGEPIQPNYIVITDDGIILITSFKNVFIIL